MRVNLIPGALANRGVSLDEVRQALSSANANRPKGMVENDQYHWQVMASDQLDRAEQYRPLIVAWRDGAAVRLSDVASVEDSVEDLYQTGFYNDRKAILMIVRRQADANIIETVDAVRAQLPQLAALLPGRRGPDRGAGSHAQHPRLAARGRADAGHRGGPGGAGGAAVPAPAACRLHSQRGGAGIADRHLLCDVLVRLHAEHHFAHGP
ncbi:AcrB/AcrD/AcrF family protein [Bordetella pertussis]|nr:AcrB/AcrD/AcrF family protein [Bordetella pertussis]